MFLLKVVDYVDFENPPPFLFQMVVYLMSYDQVC